METRDAVINHDRHDKAKSIGKTVLCCILIPDLSCIRSRLVARLSIIAEVLR